MTDQQDLAAAPAYRETMEKLEKIKHVSARGTDYWRAREIYQILGYAEWRNFEMLIQRAKEASDGVKIPAENHFVATNKMVGLGSGAARRVSDLFLTRWACYLIAMNGEPSKPEIAAAQAYFAVQTRRMELRDQEDAQLAHDERRLELRERVTQSAKRVSRAAANAGVRSSSQGIFHDRRYRGLYNASLKELKQKKGVGDKENLMDRAGPMELSANDFQMNLAAEVIDREKIQDEARAIQRNHDVAVRVRKVIEESGSTLPEDLPIEPPIRVVKQRVKSARKKLPKPD